MVYSTTHPYQRMMALTDGHHTKSVRSLKGVTQVPGKKASRRQVQEHLREVMLALTDSTTALTVSTTSDLDCCPEDWAYD